MKSELPWGSDILVPVFPLWVMMWLFPKKSVFWFFVKSIPLTAQTPPYNWYVMLMLSSISATWTSVKQIQVIGLQLVASTRQFAVWRESSGQVNCLSPFLQQTFLLPCFVQANCLLSYIGVGTCKRHTYAGRSKSGRCHSHYLSSFLCDSRKLIIHSFFCH